MIFQLSQAKDLFWADVCCAFGNRSSNVISFLAEDSTVNMVDLEGYLILVVQTVDGKIRLFGKWILS